MAEKQQEVEGEISSTMGLTQDLPSSLVRLVGWRSLTHPSHHPSPPALRWERKDGRAQICEDASWERRWKGKDVMMVKVKVLRDGEGFLCTGYHTEDDDGSDGKVRMVL